MYEQIFEVPAEPEYEIEKPERRCLVTDDAHETLDAWGVSPYHIDSLAALSAKYEYADCLNKLEQVAQRGGVITMAEDGESEAVLLPGFFDLSDRPSGQCVEIAAKNKRDITQDWMPEVNAENQAKGLPDLHTYWIKGAARTHFTSDTEPHFWVGIGPAGATPEEMITIDGSFREISKQVANGYRPRFTHRNASSFATPEACLVKMSDIDLDETSWHADIKAPVVVGLTNDRQHIINLGFAVDRSTEDGVVRPLLHVRGADGVSNAFCLRIGEEIIWGDENEIVDEANKQEVEALLYAAEQIQFTEDPQAGWHYGRETVSIQY